MTEQLVIDVSTDWNSKYGDRLLISPDKVRLFCGDIWKAKSLQHIRKCTNLATRFWIEKTQVIWCFCDICINTQTMRFNLGQEILDENEVRNILCIMQVNGS